MTKQNTGREEISNVMNYYFTQIIKRLNLKPDAINQSQPPANFIYVVKNYKSISQRIKLTTFPNKNAFSLRSRMKDVQVEVEE